MFFLASARGQTQGLKFFDLALRATTSPNVPNFSLVGSLLLLYHKKAATLPPVSFPINLCVKFIVWCDFVVFLGSQLLGYLSLRAVTQ